MIHLAGSGSTLAAAEAIGYLSIGTDRDAEYFEMGGKAFDALVNLTLNGNGNGASR